MQGGVKRCVGFHSPCATYDPCNGHGAQAVSDVEQHVLSFLNACSERISSLAGTALAAKGAEAFRRALQASVPLPAQPNWLPVLDTIDHIDDAPRAQQFARIARMLPWQPTFRTDDRGTLIALAPMNEVRRLDGVTVGVLYVGPGHQYPLHSHPPNELYLTVAGTALWRYGGQTELRPVGPDEVILNHPNDLHTTVAGPTPLVALYLLWD